MPLSADRQGDETVHPSPVGGSPKRPRPGAALGQLAPQQWAAGDPEEAPPDRLEGGQLAQQRPSGGGRIRRTRSSPVALLVIAVWVLSFALNDRTKGLILAGVVWAVVALLLARWWRGRHYPRPPNHAV
jgi:hypothetical protein